jgi:hypothetical protein
VLILWGLSFLSSLWILDISPLLDDFLTFCGLSLESGDYFLCSTGAWTQGLHLEPLHHPHLCEGFFKIGSCKLFAWAGFKLWSSWSLPPE